MVKDIIKSQPEINIGLVGHVDHGKTTLVKALSGKWTDTHSEELKRGITIRLGYADCIFYKCSKCNAYSVSEKCSCGGKATALRKVSFVDAPGHESLMATMLSGATIMDGALILISATEGVMAQTREHFMALQIAGIKNVVVAQNKIDVVDDKQAVKDYNEIHDFLKNTEYKNAPIIPISAKNNINIEILIKAIEENIPTPARDLDKSPIMLIVRSFDINKPGTEIDNIKGGVLGGSLKQGKLIVGQEIEIKPGRKVERKNQIMWESIKTKITGLMTGGESVKEIIPGGNVALLTSLDPGTVKSDSLAGSMAGNIDKLPQMWYELDLEIHLLENVIGSKAKVNIAVEPIKTGEPLMLNLNAATTLGMVSGLGKGRIHCKLKIPVCANAGDIATISRRVENRFRLIGYGVIQT